MAMFKDDLVLEAESVRRKIEGHVREKVKIPVPKVEQSSQTMQHVHLEESII